MAGEPYGGGTEVALDVYFDGVIGCLFAEQINFLQRKYRRLVLCFGSDIGYC